MDNFSAIFVLSVILLNFCQINSQCLNGCTCATDGHGRSLLCMEASLDGIPENIPQDFTKIRIENAHFTEIPRAYFSRLRALEHLWLNFNEINIIHTKSWEGLRNLTELRLQGNKLRSVPWTAFEDTPGLKIIDLKHNRLDVLPEHALKYLPSLTYLDLSFNQLTVISKDVFLNWPLYHKVKENGEVANVVLALHDNPWLCDCRLKGLVEFVRAISPPIILMNSYLSCSGPQLRAGKFFHEIELKTCMKPVATTSVTNITLPVGGSVTLTCLAMARPEPTVWWTYGLKILRGFNESRTQMDEDTTKLQLAIPSLLLADRGLYTCTANNFIGNSSASTLVEVQSPDGSSPLSLALPAAALDENVYIDIRIAKQTVYGITIEWYAVLENPAETWFTIHFGQFDSAKKEMVYIGPGINSYSVSDLLPATKYEICVTLKNQVPRTGQCVVFVTGNDISEMEQREKLIHIIVIVFAMVLAVPAGMYACTADIKLNCFERCTKSWRKWRWSGGFDKSSDGQASFDTLQAASDEGFYRDSSEEGKPRRRSDAKAEQSPTDEVE
ncbi:leucine-rich repeat, immunoglobulin-like domain and transmembrane domain-containing protein 2 [Clupea harengus]|uniref:leucine-rich repeat, immunoglobulin-like domain and transmembrane domain-containing protein 2 n=1 Tax=Clupea harengus TaxID=7950 RepID=UPI0012AB6465|nr:leucine-rich repeat, immunoglobulin-like domain and transmembrane domain-containing protein 2 [Clupea harengus]